MYFKMSFLKIAHSPIASFVSSGVEHVIGSIDLFASEIPFEKRVVYYLISKSEPSMQYTGCFFSVLG